MNCKCSTLWNGNIYQKESYIITYPNLGRKEKFQFPPPLPLYILRGANYFLLRKAGLKNVMKKVCNWMDKKSFVILIKKKKEYVKILGGIKKILFDFSKQKNNTQLFFLCYYVKTLNKEALMGFWTTLILKKRFIWYL